LQQHLRDDGECRGRSDEAGLFGPPLRHPDVAVKLVWVVHYAAR
jgi:hypothetical protein